MDILLCKPPHIWNETYVDLRIQHSSNAVRRIHVCFRVPWDGGQGRKMHGNKSDDIQSTSTHFSH